MNCYLSKSLFHRRSTMTKSRIVHWVATCVFLVSFAALIREATNHEIDIASSKAFATVIVYPGQCHPTGGTCPACSVTGATCSLTAGGFVISGGTAGCQRVFVTYGDDCVGWIGDCSWYTNFCGNVVKPLCDAAGTPTCTLVTSLCPGC